MTATKTEEKSVPAIYGALGEVMKGLANIPKNGKMKFGNTQYDYLRADDVQEKLNPLLTEQGIVVKSDYTVETLTRGRGEGAPYVYVHLKLTYIAITDGSAVTVSAVGESDAPDGKSINKALTQAIKNCHRATFQFASGETEPDDVKPGTDDTPKALKTAQQAPAKVTHKGTAAKIKADYIDTGKVAKETVNGMVNNVKAKSKKDGEELKGEALYAEVEKRIEEALESGEIGG